ncbi:MAG: hypothetical protein K0Q79_2584 [Flavipsychrobacter sp.]|jgi:hypothetical protein|nr:hypothetical protein [Flavipsychrobacter sp.]
MTPAKLPVLLFAAGIVASMAMIWLPGYYLTGDGPCHVYNAQILHDLVAGRNTEFYSRYYEILWQPNPNWFTTMVLALLMFVVNGVVAEKIFLTLYVLVYVGGFYVLLKKVSGKVSWLLLAVFLFVFTHALTKGFYNFSFSIAFYFWTVWAWLQYLEERRLKTGLLFFLFLFLVFFTHLLSFGITMVSCAAITVSGGIALKNKKGMVAAILQLLLLAAPFVAIMLWFANKEGGLQLQFSPHPYRMIELAQFKHGVNFDHNELLWTTIAGSTILLLFVLVVIKFRGLRQVHRYDGLLYTWIFVMLVYLFFPEDIIGRAMDMSVRTQLFVMVLTVLIIAYRLRSEKILGAGAFVLFGCFIVLSGLRFGSIGRISGTEKELLSVGKYLKPNTVLLPLCFNVEGADETGKPLADWNASFRHGAQYLATAKPLIVLDNYEANTGYFPIKWKEGISPYQHFGPLEDLPPYGNIAVYKQKSGVDIDYILMWCYDSAALQNENFRRFYGEISSGYNIIYTSPTGRVILYGK